MKRAWLLPLAFGLMLGFGGAVSGLLWWNAFQKRQYETASAMIKDFNMQSIAAGGAAGQWEMIRDETSEPQNRYTDQSNRISRIIVARKEVPLSDGDNPANAFEGELQAYVNSNGRMSMSGGGSSSSSGSRDGKQFRDCRRHHSYGYRIGMKSGSLDSILTIRDTEMTVVLVWIE